MKKYNFAIAIIAASLALVSCSKDEKENVVSDELIPISFGVSLDQGLQTRAAVSGLDLGAGTQNVYWEDGDKVSVFATGHAIGNTFTFKTWGSPKTVGTFDGYSYSSGPYYGLYPAQDGARLSSDNKLSFNIPCNQTAVKGSFDPLAGIEIGKAENWQDDAIDLKPVCAYFVVYVDKYCTDVEVQAVSNDDNTWYLAGDVTAEKVSSGSTAVTISGTCQSTINLKGGNLSEGGYFLIPFIPSTKFPKLMVTASFDREVQVDAGNGSSYITTIPAKTLRYFIPTEKSDGTAGTFSFAAGNLYSLGSFKYDSSSGTYVWSK